VRNAGVWCCIVGVLIIDPPSWLQWGGSIHFGALCVGYGLGLLTPVIWRDMRASGEGEGHGW
jgi:hypothetical protein